MNGAKAAPFFEHILVGYRQTTNVDQDFGLTNVILELYICYYLVIFHYESCSVLLERSIGKVCLITGLRKSMHSSYEIIT